ncbi:acyl-ACP--UDP-N-acetylglucosamine O-acyltransferase [Ruficoccus amylovorans]|uniref:Acyl-ACP--UDP-N-acetylglucosamine O-acyltransferase n=1 Tax=Ruficoccus amylovorans TaxID=1804625 RepID=A0A842HKI6_9BACT|nr:acyl-ACP--UDP-N-acetylglucosamine O-acyltransferase [Ruficoccus amylovorans]MBC2596458.1 acyl-ACP--UDP-N-acetylglucosamine O-acyltransferase [Ruficoccus amylovorans]
MSEALIEPGATFGADCNLAPFAVLKAGAVLGDGVTVDHFTVVGGLPQDLKFDPATKSGVRIGAGSVLREGVTVHRATREGAFTEIGKNCLLMANSHVGHDSVLGDNVIMANGALLGGHVHVGKNAFISGNAVIHQHVRVGEGCIISGGSRVGLDVPPFVIVDGKNTVGGLNLVGLRRRGHTAEEIADLKNCYRAIYMSEVKGSAADKAATVEPKTATGKIFIDFFADRGRGFIHARR